MGIGQGATRPVPGAVPRVAGVLQRGPLLALRWCALLTEALTAFLRCLRSAYRSVLFPALMGTDFSPACGHLQDTFLPPMHRAELR